MMKRNNKISRLVIALLIMMAGAVTAHAAPKLRAAGPLHRIKKVVRWNAANLLLPPVEFRSSPGDTPRRPIAQAANWQTAGRFLTNVVWPAQLASTNILVANFDRSQTKGEPNIYTPAATAVVNGLISALFVGAALQGPMLRAEKKITATREKLAGVVDRTTPKSAKRVLGALADGADRALLKADARLRQWVGPVAEDPFQDAQ
jgi:hypothetical protein